MSAWHILLILAGIILAINIAVIVWLGVSWWWFTIWIEFFDKKNKKDDGL